MNSEGSEPGGEHRGQDRSEQDGGSEEAEVSAGEQEPEYSEGRIPRVTRGPREPTRLEREMHDVSHLAPRDWCSHCRRGRGISGAHRHRAGERDFPIISMDYAYIGHKKKIFGDSWRQRTVKHEENHRLTNQYLHAAYVC